MNFTEEGEIGSKSREDGEIGSESREKGDLPPCSTPLYALLLCGLFRGGDSTLGDSTEGVLYCKFGVLYLGGLYMEGLIFGMLRYLLQIASY